MSTIVPAPKKAKVTELNDYRLVALTSVIMKCFERLVKDHITIILPDTLDPLQFAYRPNRSTDDAIALHTALSQLDKRNTYVRIPAQRITGGTLPALQDTYSTRCHRKAKKIIKDNNHPSHCLFTPHLEGEVSTGASKLGPRDCKTAYISRPSDC